mmetsp:Transcript_8687/g.26928  ORF Transcript_8687/g.26928 Transcript_8687/m.26928 type:complete len:251 (-) Transcript_8687:1163-1915(-)
MIDAPAHGARARDEQSSDAAGGFCCAPGCEDVASPTTRRRQRRRDHRRRRSAPELSSPKTQPRDAALLDSASRASALLTPTRAGMLAREALDIVRCSHSPGTHASSCQCQPPFSGSWRISLRQDAGACALSGSLPSAVTAAGSLPSMPGSTSNHVPSARRRWCSQTSSATISSIDADAACAIGCEPTEALGASSLSGPSGPHAAAPSSSSPDVPSCAVAASSLRRRATPRTKSASFSATSSPPAWLVALA